VNDEAEEVDFWKPVQDPLNMNLIDINEQVKEIKFPFMDRVTFWKSLKLTDDYDFPESLISSRNEKILDLLKISSSSSEEDSSQISNSTLSSLSTDSSKEITETTISSELIIETTSSSDFTHSADSDSSNSV